MSFCVVEQTEKEKKECEMKTTKIIKSIIALIWIVMGIVSVLRGDVTDGLLFAILLILTPYIKEIGD